MIKIILSLSLIFLSYGVFSESKSIQELHNLCLNASSEDMSKMYCKLEAKQRFLEEKIFKDFESNKSSKAKKTT